MDFSFDNPVEHGPIFQPNQALRYEKGLTHNLFLTTLYFDTALVYPSDLSVACLPSC